MTGEQTCVPGEQPFSSGKKMCLMPSKQVFISGEQVSMCHTRRNVCLVSRYRKSV